MELIAYYDHHTQILKGSIISKAKKFNKFKCVEEISINQWIVKPIEGYNKTAYTIRYINGVWSCDCQRGSTGLVCSHILAVMLFVKLNYDDILDQFRSKEG